MKDCPYCSRQLEDPASFCDSCGSVQPEDGLAAQPFVSYAPPQRPVGLKRAPEVNLFRFILVLLAIGLIVGFAVGGAVSLWLQRTTGQTVTTTTVVTSVQQVVVTPTSTSIIQLPGAGLAFNYYPLLTALVAFVFTLFLARQFIKRRKRHQILWTVAMLFYALSALMEFLMNRNIIGANATVFRVYYILAAPLVGLLGAGVVYLLVRKKIADYFLGFVIMLSIGLAIGGLIVPVDSSVLLKSFSGELAEGFRAATQAYPMWVRVFSIILNFVGGTILIGGALYSFIRDRTRTYNLLIVLGAILPMIGGSLMGLLGNPNLFFEFELGGTVFLFLGFVFSDTYIIRQERSRTRTII